MYQIDPSNPHVLFSYTPEKLQNTMDAYARAGFCGFWRRRAAIIALHSATPAFCRRFQGEFTRLPSLIGHADPIFCVFTKTSRNRMKKNYLMNNYDIKNVWMILKNPAEISSIESKLDTLYE